MTVLYELATTRNPMRPPFSKGDIEQPAKFPLFEKEGLGEIFGVESGRQNFFTASNIL